MIKVNNLLCFYKYKHNISQITESEFRLCLLLQQITLFKQIHESLNQLNWFSFQEEKNNNNQLQS